MKTVVAALCFLGFQAAVCAEDMKLRWAETPQSLIAGRKVQVRLAGGAVVHGKGIAVTPEGLRMEITKAGGAGTRYARGEGFVPAGEIVSMKVSRSRSRIRNRIIFTSLFGGLSAVGGVGAAIEGGGSFTPGAVVLLAGFPAGGYALGWFLDRRPLTIRFVP